jgi:hypothetical protein
MTDIPVPVLPDYPIARQSGICGIKKIVAAGIFLNPIVMTAETFTYQHSFF